MFPRRNRCASRSCTIRRRTTRACTPGCRRRRSPTQGSLRSKLRHTPRRSTTSTSCASRTRCTISLRRAPPRSRTTSAPMAISAETRLVALLGHPVAHSLSPRMQNAAFAARALDWAYVALDVPPERLAEAVRGLAAAGFVGANATAPHKVAMPDAQVFARRNQWPPDVEGADIVVHATPVRDEALFELRAGQTLIDLPYPESATARAARERGATVIDGLEVLVRQGAASFERWTGVPAPLDVMRNAVRSAP